MTKKDYQLIATAIWRAGFMLSEEGNKQVREAKQKQARLIAINLATDLLVDNPKFDRNKFMTACGFEGE